MKIWKRMTLMYSILTVFVLNWLSVVDFTKLVFCPYEIKNVYSETLQFHNISIESDLRHPDNETWQNWIVFRLRECQEFKWIIEEPRAVT